MRWPEHVAHMGERKGVYRVFFGGEEHEGGRNMRERDHLGDTGVDGRIILRWNFRKWDVGVWT